MNHNALNRGFINNFERNAPFDFYVFYPQYVTRYDYQRDVEGHIVDIDDSEPLTHEDIREFVRASLPGTAVYTDLNAAYTKQLPSNKVYDFEGKKLVVRHMRGHWTTASSMKDINVYYNNPLYGSTSINLAHNFYMCWVGGYQRNRVYYGDLIVPVARQRFGPTVRNESILPVHIVRGILTPDRIDGTGLVVEDWLESREEYTEEDWTDSRKTEADLNESRYYVISDDTDHAKYRIIYIDDSGVERVIYFEANENGEGVISRSPIPAGVTTYTLDSMCEELNSGAY